MRGVVELKTLLGHEYRPEQIGDAYVDPTIWDVQRTIFPDYPNLPLLLDDIERLLDAATVHTLLRPITDEMMESLIQFRDYASATIEQVHRSMKESGGGDNRYNFRYTSMDLVLLEQLGMTRRDREMRESGGTDSDVKELLKQQSAVQTAWMQAQIEEKQALTELHRRQASMIDADTMKEKLEAVNQQAKNGVESAPRDHSKPHPELPDRQHDGRWELGAPLEGYSGYGGQSGYSGYSGEVTMAPEEPVQAVTFSCPDCDHAPFPTKSGYELHARRWCPNKKE